jgi:hypothetical protein
MIDSKQYPLCEQLLDRLFRKFSDNGWITLCDKRIFSCLANDDVAAKSMTYDTWDINHSEGGPLINEQLDGTFISYSRYSNDEVEPIVMYLENEGRWPEEVFLAEEFVMYFKLHKEAKGKNEYVYYQVDECGDDVEVARVAGINLEVKLKYVKEYIAVKKLNLLVFTDEVINDTRSINELGGNIIPWTTIKDSNFIFSYALQESAGYGLEYKSCAVFRGKCMMRYNDKDIQHLWKLRDSGYEDFVVGADEDGKEVFMSCEENRMPNLFTRQGDEPYSLSPVFFKRDVLSKYFQAVDKYSVQDGDLSGPSWGIRIDNDRSDDYVVAALVDLGRMPHKEQLHWKSFNVLPPRNGSYSTTTFSRWFAAIPTNCSEAPDLVFKQLYIQVNDKWRSKYGWPLFKELAADDQYHFETLHLMGQENDQKEFDGLIQSITKLIIDSLNEKQLVKAIDSTKPDVLRFLSERNIKESKPSNIQGGITKFECFLISEGLLDSNVIKLLRNIQDLRSSTVAHRKNTKLDTKTEELFNFFGILQESDKVVLLNLLVRLNKMLNWIISTTK